ncbi:MAG: alpha/beta hydrolase [Flavobacteriaceae bacterium]
MRKLARGVGWGLLVYGALVLMLTVFQERLIFLPKSLAQDHVYDFPHPFEEINLKTADGAVLNALHFTSEAPKGVIVYYHGNAGNLERWGQIVLFFVDMGYDVLVMDYRTYGKSTGRLSEEALYADANLFYQYALDRYPEDRITLYGRSLGTGLATWVAAQHQPAQLILETPYYSLTDVAQHRFPFLPVRWLLRYRLPSFQYIKKVASPITVFHGTEDRVVPYTSGEKLYQAIAHSHKRLVTIPGGRHNDLVTHTAYLQGIAEVLGP